MDFHSVYLRYATDVHRFAHYLSGDAAAADDLTSDAFLRLWTAPGEIRMPTVKAYLFAIVRNLYRTSLRGLARVEPLEDEHQAPEPSAEQQVVSRSQLSALAAALARLPEADRAAVLMRAQGEMSYEEIGQALGISVAAARVRVHRARARLAERCGESVGVARGLQSSRQE